MEREVNGNVNATTNLNTQAEEDVRILATVYMMYKIGEFYVLIFLNRVTIPHLCLNLKLGGLNFEDEII